MSGGPTPATPALQKVVSHLGQTRRGADIAAKARDKRTFNCPQIDLFVR
jgi:hypothetical protein